MREGIAAIIKNEPDMQLVAEASNGREAIQGFREHCPDVTLMDLRLPDISGIDAMVAIRAEFADARIIMLTTFEGDVEIRRALQAGAVGYMLKTMPRRQLVETIRRVHAGKKSFAAPKAAERLTGYLKPERFTVYLRGEGKPLFVKARMNLDPKGNTELLQEFWGFPEDPAHPDVVPPYWSTQI